ncbi:FKBP-type peptidyl-prolyl cis-trans isomerase [Alkanindiges sp. WGS2144]|uniref:FKBP-type peptidyl-prolyl cis-trans isomerase n=1 Tax=Alkanindiges sp. WGS2144 TaxID=3366808 RepID=UPI0037515158
MKKSLIWISCAMLGVSGCSHAVKPASQAVVKQEHKATTVNDQSSELQKVGYSFGYLMGKSNVDAVKDLDVNSFVQGFRDGYGGQAAVLTEEQMKNALLQYKQNQDAQEMKAFEQLGKANAEQGAEFLRDNGKKAGVTTTASGLQYEVLKQGSGKRPTADSQVTVHYEGRLINGTVFDSSIDRGEPITFPLDQVIAGWTEGLQLMQEGAKYRLFIPANLAYGETGAGQTVGANSTLIFDVELLKVEK